MRVIEGRHGLGFALEALAAIGIRGQRIRQNLDGDVTGQLAVAGAIDFTHSGGAKRRDDLVRADASR